MDDQISLPEQENEKLPEEKKEFGAKKIILLSVACLVALLAGLILYINFIGQSAKVAPQQFLSPAIKKEAPVQKLYQNPDDTDMDGVSNADEAKLGTSDLEVDTDGDGLSDYDEIHIWRTDPKNPDTDGDGYIDGYEVVKGYDPLTKAKK